MVGRQLGIFTIVAEVGRGGMGVVYEAEDTRLQRRVALKVLPPEIASDPSSLERFQREARAVAALNHPNIVTVHSVEEADGVRFLTMELVRGRSLGDLIGGQGLALPRLLAIAVPLADALSAAHAAGITHRDLKPANVMVDDDGRVKVLDFGLAKWHPEATAVDDATITADQLITGEGQILGTVPYMSPEQLEGKPVDHRTDIFSLGVILYEMVTGQRPFKGESAAATMSAILRDEPAPVSEVRRNLPRQLGRIVNRCLQKQPDDRYQTARGVRNDLRELEREVDHDSSATRAAAPDTGRRRMPWPWLAPLAALLLVAAVAIWWPRGGGDTSDAPAAAEQAQRQMIVVLPFENLGASDDDYFADGLTEEITSRLATVQGLGVISRTSAMQYKDNRPSLREIGEQLGVAYVLEGTVRWERRADGSSRVRVTPQLIRVSDDTHLWADRYDRDLSEIFAVQGDIAAEVARELNITLLEPQRDALRTQLTGNMEAYQAYLRGMELWTRPGYDAVRFRLAIEMFERAVELDPRFVEAWAELANAHDMLFQGGDAGQEALAVAIQAIETAERLAPDHPVVHLAKGYHYYLGYLDYDRALVEFARVEEARPDDPTVHEAIGFIRRRQGRLDDGIDRLERAVRLDPQNAHTILMLAGTHAARRHHAVADSLFDRVISLEPDAPDAYWERSANLLSWRGSVAEARAVVMRIPGRNSDVRLWADAVYDVLDRQFATAAEKFAGVDPTNLISSRAAAEFHVGYGRVLRRLGRHDDARTQFELGADAILAEGQDAARVRVAILAVVHAYLGDEDAARRHLQESHATRPDDQFYAVTTLFDHAVAEMLLGDHDAAVETLGSLLEREYFMPLSKTDLRLDPLWDPLREHPGFAQLLAPRDAAGPPGDTP